MEHITPLQDYQIRGYLPFNIVTPRGVHSRIQIQSRLLKVKFTPLNLRIFLIQPYVYQATASEHFPEKGFWKGPPPTHRPPPP